MTFLMRLDLEAINKLYLDAVLKQQEDMIISMWERLYPFMLCGIMEFFPLKEFKENCLKSKNVSNLSNEQIIDKFQNIIANDRQVKK